MTTRNGISRRESLKLMFGMLFLPLLKWLPKEKKREKFDFEKEIQGRVATVVGPLEWPSGKLIVGPSPAAMKAMEWPEDWRTKGIVDRHELLSPVHKDIPPCYDLRGRVATKEEIISVIRYLPHELQLMLWCKLHGD